MRIRPIRLSLERRKVVAGYLFCLPFLIGFAVFFLRSFVQAVVFSVNELELTRTGFNLSFLGFANYEHALVVHATFPRVLIETLLRTMVDVPLILAFSFFTALILNQKF